MKLYFLIFILFFTFSAFGQNIENSPAYAQLISKRAELQSRLDNLKKTHRDNHPDVIQAQSTLDKINDDVISLLNFSQPITDKDVLAAQVEFNASKRELARTRELFETGAVALIDVERAESRQRDARFRLNDVLDRFKPQNTAEVASQSKFSDKAIVYIYSYKTAKTLGSLKLPAFMDGKEIGKFRPTRYFIAMITPGTHSFHLKNKQKGGIEMNFEAGKTYYLRGVWDAGATVSLGGIMRMEAENGAYDIKQLRPVDEGDIKDKKIVFTKLPE